MAQRLAAALDPVRFGVKAVYLFGSTKNGTAGPASDIDLLLHVEDEDARRRDLAAWLEGWSLSLAEANYVRTGYRSDGLLDVHYVTDADIARGGSYASKIGAVTDAARPLQMGAAGAGASRDGARRSAAASPVPGRPGRPRRAPAPGRRGRPRGRRCGRCGRATSP